MKTILSIADLSIILDLVNEQLAKLVYREKNDNTELFDYLEYKPIKLKEHPYYKSLIHLKTALENLNLEIETPDIKVEVNKNE